MSLHKSNTAWSWWAPPSYLRHYNCDWLSHTKWSNGSCWCIPRGMVAAILFPADQVMCDWLNHITWFHSNQALPRSMEFESILLNFFYIIQSPICYVGCLMIANTWIYIFLYLKNTAILENKKKFVFSHINLWTLVTFTFTPRKLFKLTNRRHLYWVCANILQFSLKFIKFQSHLKKNLALVIYFGCE